MIIFLVVVLWYTWSKISSIEPKFDDWHVSLMIYVFCTSWEPGIVPPVLQNKNNFAFATHTKHGILLPKLFWPTVRKNCSSDRGKLLKFEAEGREFAKFLRSLEQFFLTVGQNNFGNKIPFIHFFFRRTNSSMHTVQSWPQNCAISA